MADLVFNIAKGRVAHLATLPAANDALVAVLVKQAGLEADAGMRDHDTLAAVLAGTTDEADFTNYARKTLVGTTVTVDDVNDRVNVDSDDLTWAAAGGAVNNTFGALIICYDPDTTLGTDADLVPLVKMDVVGTTDGNDYVIQFAAEGWYRAA